MEIDANRITEARDTLFAELVACDGDIGKWLSAEKINSIDVTKIMRDAWEGFVLATADDSFTAEEAVQTSLLLGMSLGWIMHRDNS